MAQPIHHISRPVKTEREQETESLEQLISSVAKSKDSIEESIEVLRELHESGILEAISAMVAAKEQISKILVEQALRPEATAMVNHMMGIFGGMTKMSPDMTSKLMQGLVQGIHDGNDAIQSKKPLGIFDIAKSIRDPDVNRTLQFAFGFLSGFGKQL